MGRAIVDRVLLILMALIIFMLLLNFINPCENFYIGSPI